jgi:hypothetical protein
MGFDIFLRLMAMPDVRTAIGKASSSPLAVSGNRFLFGAGQRQYGRAGMP